MRRVLITGMSGTGKSSVIGELVRLGYRAVDADSDGYSHMVDVDPEELTGPGEGRDWVWREDRMSTLLASEDGDLLFVGGCAPNQGKFYDRFDLVVLLSAPAPTIVERLRTRTTNDFGKAAGELERTLQLVESVEPLLRRRADVEIDTTLPMDEVIERLLKLALDGPVSSRG